jgi:hypothetical protein
VYKNTGHKNLSALINMERSSSSQLLKSTWSILRVAYVIFPIIIGIDKFTDILVNWDKYLNPGIGSILPVPVHTFMKIVGVIEIISGLIVLFRPAIGGYIIMMLFIFSALQYLSSDRYFDIALRDLMMSIGALTLARISKIIQPVTVRTAHFPVPNLSVDKQ